MEQKGIELTKTEFEEALKDAVECGKPVFIDVIIDRREIVLPMVPAGGSLANTIVEYKDPKQLENKG